MSHSETPEQWWIEVRRVGLHWEALAKSSHDRCVGTDFEGFPGFPFSRLTEAWAVAAARRALRKCLQREARAEEQTRVYPANL